MANVIEVAGTTKERGKIAPAKFAHFVVRTPRYEEMIRWSQAVPGVPPNRHTTPMSRCEPSADQA